MKFLLPILTFVLLAVGCSTAPKEEPIISNPVEAEEFGVYIRLFQREAEVRGLDLYMPKLDRSLRVYKVDKFNQELQDDSVIGLCVKNSGRVNIYIDKTAWNTSDSLQREMLLFHELGHCALDLDHDRSLDSSGVPNDIMYPVSFDSLYYYKYRKFYLDRMFKKAGDRIKNGSSDTKEETISACRWGLEYSNGKLTHAFPRKSKRSYKPGEASKF